MKVFRLLFVALVVVAACAACGGGDNKTQGASSAPNSFADATCVDLAKWAAAVQPAFRDLQAIGSFDASDKTGAQALLDRLAQELDAADQATGTLVDGISSRAAPDIASGAEIKTEIVQALTELRGFATTTKAEIEAYNIETATAEESAKLKNDLGSVTANVTNSLAVLAPLLTNNSQLREALQNSATCQQTGSDLLGSSSN